MSSFSLIKTWFKGKVSAEKLEFDLKFSIFKDILRYCISQLSAFPNIIFKFNSNK